MDRSISTDLGGSATATEAGGTAPSSDGLTAILEGLKSGTSGGEVTLGHLLDTLDTRSYGPLLLLPALIAVAPTGAIPGMSIFTGSIIGLLALQMLAGRRHPWLPARLERFAFPRERLVSIVDAVLPWARRIERLLSERLRFLFAPPADRLIALACAVLAAMMFPLALLPFAVALPGTAIILFALGLTMKDGLLVLLGYGLTMAAAALVLWMVL